MRPLSLPILLAVLSLCLLPGCRGEKGSEAVRPVRAVEAVRAPAGVAELLTGEIEAHSYVNASFRIAGKIAQRLAAAGDHVLPGQVLARLDDTIEGNTLREARASERAAAATLDQAARKAARARSLVGQRAVSRNEYDLDVRSEKEAAAQLDAARAQLRSAKEQFGYTVLYADTEGVVASRHAESGEVVAAGQTIFRIAEKTGIDAVFDVPERLMLEGLATGREMEVCLDSDPSVCAAALVAELSPQADQSTRTYRMRASVPAPARGMLLGSTVIGRVVLSDDPVMTLPSQALYARAGASCVWVLEAEGSGVFVAHVRAVDVAGYTTGTVLVKSGLADGELVATAGVQVLHEGQRVRLADAARDGGEEAR